MKRPVLISPRLANRFGQTWEAISNGRTWKRRIEQTASWMRGATPPARSQPLCGVSRLRRGVGGVVCLGWPGRQSQLDPRLRRPELCAPQVCCACGQRRASEGGPGCLVRTYPEAFGRLRVLFRMSALRHALQEPLRGGGSVSVQGLFRADPFIISRATQRQGNTAGSEDPAPAARGSRVR
jgi:hypothetical protein